MINVETEMVSKVVRPRWRLEEEGLDGLSLIYTRGPVTAGDQVTSLGRMGTKQKVFHCFSYTEYRVGTYATRPDCPTASDAPCSIRHDAKGNTYCDIRSTSTVLRSNSS
jgi:hypothetical protein